MARGVHGRAPASSAFDEANTAPTKDRAQSQDESAPQDTAASEVKESAPSRTARTISLTGDARSRRDLPVAWLRDRIDRRASHGSEVAVPASAARPMQSRGPVSLASPPSRHGRRQARSPSTEALLHTSRRRATVRVLALCAGFGGLEWMMGLPEGWVTDVPGLSRSKQLKVLGNGVVSLQAAKAVAMLAEPLTT